MTIKILQGEKTGFRTTQYINLNQFQRAFDCIHQGHLEILKIIISYITKALRYNLLLYINTGRNINTLVLWATIGTGSQLQKKNNHITKKNHNFREHHLLTKQLE